MNVTKGLRFTYINVWSCKNLTELLYLSVAASSPSHTHSHVRRPPSAFIIPPRLTRRVDRFGFATSSHNEDLSSFKHAVCLGILFRRLHRLPCVSGAEHHSRADAAHVHECLTLVSLHVHYHLSACRFLATNKVKVDVFVKRCSALIVFDNTGFLPIGYDFESALCAGQQEATFALPAGVPSGGAYIIWYNTSIQS